MEPKLSDTPLRSVNIAANASGKRRQISAAYPAPDAGEVWRIVTGEILKLEREKRELRKALQNGRPAGDLAEDLEHRIKAHEQRIFSCEQKLDRLFPVTH